MKSARISRAQARRIQRRVKTGAHVSSPYSSGSACMIRRTPAVHLHLPPSHLRPPPAFLQITALKLNNAFHPLLCWRFPPITANLMTPQSINRLQITLKPEGTRSEVKNNYKTSYSCWEILPKPSNVPRNICEEGVFSRHIVCFT